jgi:prephenate dehydratase
MYTNKPGIGRREIAVLHTTWNPHRTMRRHHSQADPALFRVRNLPAALYKALSSFATNGVNMTKLESYMENASFTATLFYAEVDGRSEDRRSRTPLR